MLAYRTTLVWILRLGATAFLGFGVWTFLAAWHFFQVSPAAYFPRNAPSIVESAQVILFAPTLVALIGLSLAEILSLLMRRAHT